ncbi:MAG: cation-efflux pump [candidate division NC10 bacterium]|nr:cation-efflux pump [candidate division NC10 bacterium]
MASTADAPIPAGLDTNRQKVRVALTSVIAAVGLTASKAVVGWQTGSLGILSEAAHSGLDFVAALITLFAVRVADRPADRDHHYGHGKVENLSALVETALLLLTCLWIIYEAFERLFWKHAEIEPTWIAFAVMLGSIVVDVSRSRALARVARETGSQALEADALHFQTDVWGSLTVLLGLAAVWAGRWRGIAWLSLADALAAMLVAAIVLTVGGRLGKRAVDALLDRAPLDLMERIQAAVKGVPDVHDPVALRARQVGPRLFVDAAVSIGRGASFEGAHAVVEQVEERIRGVAPEASIVIHAEPLRTADESLGDAIRLIVSRHAAGAHDIFIQYADGKPAVDLHLEAPGELTLTEGHAVTERIEADLRQELPLVGRVYIHVDPMRAIPAMGVGADSDVGRVSGRLRSLAHAIPGIRDCSNISVRLVDGRIWITCHCTMDGRLSLREAHELGLELMRRARHEIPGVERVSVHAEPAEH